VHGTALPEGGGVGFVIAHDAKTAGLGLRNDDLDAHVAKRAPDTDI
jgi:hypothetical protein